MDRIIAADVFIKIVEQGSFASAARALDMSRSMVTRYLNQMEEWADTQLLHRSTRKLTLTQEGEKILNYCRELVAIAQNISSPIESDNAIKGLIRLSCSPFLAHDVLPNMIQPFLSAHPMVSIDIQISNHVTNLVEDRIDLAIRITNDLDPNIIARSLGKCHSVLCASPPYLKKNTRPVTIDDLSRHNCLNYSRFEKSVWHFTHKKQSLSAAITGNFSANDSSLLLKAALHDQGITLQPKFAVQNYINNGHLVHLLPHLIPKTLGIYGIYRSRKHQSLALREFIDNLVIYFDQLDT
ncbi:MULTISPECIES: LysR family transcriptional regulator [Pseudoalteromonas]|uniref:LysR family transcriptional regulator n=1 Tax=Pseudoalteromonas TaxID=53246 RepID=UPI0003156DC2|nr:MULTISPECIES: LysR family transcriptional regulator [Pseudoalteromonas]MCF6146494.1 hypothetical protein [Pseudoalteromonas mariniglutinosa NCIMB 1770]